MASCLASAAHHQRCNPGKALLSSCHCATIPALWARLGRELSLVAGEYTSLSVRVSVLTDNVVPSSLLSSPLLPSHSTTPDAWPELDAERRVRRLAQQLAGTRAAAVATADPNPRAEVRAEPSRTLRQGEGRGRGPALPCPASTGPGPAVQPSNGTRRGSAGLHSLELVICPGEGSSSSSRVRGAKAKYYMGVKGMPPYKTFG